MMKIQFKFSVLFLFFLFAFQSLSYAATITWTGDVSSEWFNAGNWSSTIPQPSDDVIIPAGRPNDPVVEFFTQIASMTVESGATVTIISSTLSINNASGVGLDNSGTINNAATINIQNTTDNGIFNQSGASFTNDGVIFIAGSLSSVGSNGILNEGTGTQFQNNNRIDIRQAGANALQNQGGAQFTNAVGATINIGQTTATISGDGIVNLSSGTTFTNSGTILIDKISNNGISNEGTFNNAANSVLNIGQNDGNIGANGILNFDSFINSGTINIDNVSNDGISNSINSDFNNTANATIDIGQNDGNIGDDGISNFTSFTNYGTITVDNVSDDGISNFEDSDFIHAFNGNLNIGQNAGNISGDGVANFGSFTNNSTIAIDNTTRDGIINGGIFNNVTDATINIGQNDVNINGDGIFNSTSASTFTNDGTIFIDNTISEGVRNSGTFNNNTNASLNIGQNAGNIGFDGILNNLTSSVFNNSGTIAIDNTSEEGLENEGDFNNASGAKINIGQHGGNIGLDGILNTGKFSQTGDTIKISNTGADGINNQDTLMNSGVIVIENVGSSGIFNDAVAVFLNNGTADIDATSGDGVENLGIFNNAANAMLNIGQNNRNINRDGIFNGPDSAIFMNSGTIAIDSTSDRGIKNVNDFTNAANGIINIGQYTGSIREDGISNSDTLTNNGTITIGNTVENGVTNEGAFNNTTNAILNIGQNGGNIDEDGFSNFGSFTNHGTIAIDNVSDAGISNQTDASFINASGANLDIGQNDGNIGSVGILNLNSSLSFTNNGDIQIDNVSGTGIRNRGDFSNTANATINIGQTAGNIRSLGIQNQFSSSIFMNNGTIAIDRTSSTGISNQGDFSNAVNANINIGQNGGNVGGSGLSNSPTTPSVFTNNGSIAIDKVSSDGVNNGGEFNNAANAMLNIGQNGGNIGQTGISNIQPSSSFMNDGTITIDHTSDDGIENFGNFNNTSAAILNIGQNGENIDFSGIFNVSSFTNSGILAIDNSATNGIDNTGEFNNRSTANINIGQGDGNISGNGILNRGFFSNAIFNNSGRITIDDPSSSSISGIAIVSTAQFIDTTGLIRIGQNHPFSGDVLSVDDGATFVGNDSTTIQCVGDFFIGASSTVSGIRTFELEGDWLNSGTFTANSSVVTILGTSQSIIGGNSPTTFFDLTINNSGDIVLENDVTLTRRLSLTEGKLKLEDSDFALGSSFELFSQVGSSALVTDGTGRVMSNITSNNSRIFPVGNTNYTPIIITNLGTSDEFSVGCIPEVLSNGELGNVFPTNVVNTTWLIEEAVAGGTNVILTAQWTSADELPNFDRSSTFLSRYDGTAWDSSTPTPAIGTDPYTVSRTGVTTFSPFAVGTSFVPDFSCVVNSLELNDVALASDTYSTQQSIESTSLIEVGSTVNFIAANVIELKAGFHAESGSTFAAIIDDCTLSANENETIEQRTAQSIIRTTLLFPNPVGQQLNIRDGIGQALIYNMLGQQIQAFEIIDELHSLDVSDLVSGQYVLLILRESGERVTLSFVK